MRRAELGGLVGHRPCAQGGRWRRRRHAPAARILVPRLSLMSVLCDVSACVCAASCLLLDRIRGRSSVLYARKHDLGGHVRVTGRAGAAGWAHLGRVAGVPHEHSLVGLPSDCGCTGVTHAHCSEPYAREERTRGCMDGLWWRVGGQRGAQVDEGDSGPRNAEHGGKNEHPVPVPDGMRKFLSTAPTIDAPVGQELRQGRAIDHHIGRHHPGRIQRYEGAISTVEHHHTPQTATNLPIRTTKWPQRSRMLRLAPAFRAQRLP